MTVYRGELVQAHKPGISWTTDFQVAKRYARNYATVGHTQVIQAVAPPAAVLGRFARDAEVVVAPEFISLRQHDLVEWRRYLAKVDRVDSIGSAFRYLNLDYVKSPWPSIL
jgi:hypothetical protein